MDVTDGLIDGRKRREGCRAGPVQAGQDLSVGETALSWSNENLSGPYLLDPSRSWPRSANVRIVLAALGLLPVRSCSLPKLNPGLGLTSDE